MLTQHQRKMASRSDLKRRCDAQVD